MMRSLFSGVTGLRSHQTKMDVIGNNISNVNTLGFKKSAVNFADLYSETASQASAPTGNNGGVNAKQIGLGVSTNHIVVKHNPGAAQYTGNTLDLAIAGDGFFAVRVDNAGERYTRAGNLSVSSNGSLVTSNGYFVQCFGSMYQQGNAGVITGTAGLGDDIATRGFEKFRFDQDDGSIMTGASGTYTFEMTDTGKTINVLKNGVVWKKDVPLQVYNDADDVKAYEPYQGDGYGPNQLFQVVIEDLGTITFQTSPHSLSVSGLNQSYPPTAGTTPQITSVSMEKDIPWKDDLTAGTYKLQFNDDGTLDLVASMTASEARKALGIGENETIELDNDNTISIGGTKWTPKPDKDNPTSFTSEFLKGVKITNNTAGGTDPEFKMVDDGNGKKTLQANLQAACTYTINLGGKEGLGEIQFQTGNGTGIRDYAVAMEELVKKLTMRVTKPSTEGSDSTSKGTAFNYLNSLMQGASVNITNNDGFTALNARNDMIIDQNLYENVSIGSDGSVMAQLKQDWTSEEGTTFAKGEKVILGYIALTTFSNYEGLEKVGTNLYAMTQNSGRPVYNLAGEGGTGEIASSSLEMSNVDLSEEFVNMITTQRGFQANSRIITTSDTMLEELINLKR